MWKTYFRKDSEKVSIEYAKVLHSEQTDIQLLEILETKTFGKAIFMDNCPEISAFDAAPYHEAMVHPACIVHGGVKSAFVVGGGEGVMLRELLKHADVAKIVQCDIDEKAIKAFDKHLPDWHRGSYHDPRVTLLFEDARGALEKSTETYDLVLVDITAPIADGPSYRLFTKEFYELVRRRLNPGGVVVSQAQSVNANNLSCFSALYHTVRSVFSRVEPMHYPFAITGDDWGLLFSSDDRDPLGFGAKAVEAEIARRRLELEFYSGRCHQSLFNLPKYVYDYLERNRSISTDAAPFRYPDLGSA